jgi:hypothetical protein
MQPTKSNVEIRQALTASALDLGPIPARDYMFGYGLVQAMEALDYFKAPSSP